jgi:GT2 family glycosyltransferase
MDGSSNKIVSIIVVTRGVGEYLWSCLDSLKVQTNPVFEIIVIDNSGNQDFSLRIKKLHSEVKLYSQTKNLFYCQALNKGIESSKGDFILCLNDDVILDEKFIEEALRGFSPDSKVGMVSGKVLRFDKETIDTTGLFLSLWRTAKERGYGSKDVGQFGKEGYIFGVNGAVAFYKRKMLEDIKINTAYFDTDYQIFYEDLDIAWRAQNSSWKAYYIPQAIAYHARGATVRLSRGIGKPYARRYLDDNLHLNLINNRHATIIKNESWPGLLLHLPFILCYDLLVLSYNLFFNFTLFKKNLPYFEELKIAFKKRTLIRKKLLENY